MFRRLSYETVRDGHADPAPDPWAKLKPVVALALATATLWGLSAVGIFDSRSNIGGAAVGSAGWGWQDQQPLAGETLTAFSQDLKQPDDRHSKGGELRTTLRVAPAVSRAGPLAPLLNVRAYEGSVPGPTLRVKPGDRLVVSLANELGLPEGAPSAGHGDRASLEGKVEAWPNVTNIHVHGLHVSPAGVGDNIYRRAGPGDTLEYIYELPADHYPGVFYYHPHFEGSSSVQTLGGMSGAIVVEDPAGSLPTEVEQMREVVMVLQETNIESGALRNYKAASKIAGSKMPLYGNGREVGKGDEEEEEGVVEEKGEMLHFVTVNGQYQPVLGAQPGEAIRVRLVHGGNNDHMYLSVVPTKKAAAGSSGSSSSRREGNEGSVSGCTLLTLARDGVYLPAPRRQGGGGGRVVLAPGSRADLAVRCDQPGVYRLVSSKRRAANSGGEADGVEAEGEEKEVPIMAYLGQKTDVFEGTLAFMDVGGKQLDMELPTKSPAALGGGRLLKDLRELPDNEVSRFLFEFNAAGKVSHLDQTYTWYGINRVQYNNASQVMRRVPLGSVEEWVIVNQRKGRGEGAEGCHSHSPRPPATTTPAAAGSKGPIDGWGQRRRRSKRRGLGESRPGGGGVEQEENEEGGAEARAACERAGPGEVTADGHPFHLHVNHFQVVSSSWGDEGPDWNVGDWRDTISIPTPGNVTIRWRADDFTGEAVAHCHIFGHSDTGMMMNFEIFAER